MVEVAAPAEYCLLGIQSWASCQTKAEWASWAQAAFTLATLGGGALAVWWETHQRRKEARQLTAEALLARFAVLRLVAGQWEAYLQTYELSQADFERVHAAKLIALELALTEGRAVELRDMPTAKCVEHLVQIRAAMYGGDKILAAAAQKGMTTDQIQRMRAGQRTLMKGLDGIWEEAKRLRG